MAERYIRSCVNTLHKYCISRKNTKSAERMSPIPKLNIIMQKIGTNKRRKAGVKVIVSIMQKMKKTISVSAKFISEETFREKRKRYFGTFIFVKISAFPRREPIPPFVESEKYEKIIFPQKI